MSEEFLKPKDISQTRLAEHLGWTAAKVNEIVNGKRGITSESALALSDAFGTSPEFWLNLQQNYDLWTAHQEHRRVARFG